MSFGGDVIVEGVVEGDVATIGGSVIQKAGSRIGGDVIVLGGTYRADDTPAQSQPEAMTMMYAGYQQELRDMMRNPTGLVQSALDADLFRNEAAGGAVLVSRFARIHGGDAGHDQPRRRALQLTSLRVAAIGLIGVVVLFGGVLLCLWIMPEPIRVLVGLLALLLWLVAGLFGRVILYAATGRWLQRKYVPLVRIQKLWRYYWGPVFGCC